MTNPVPHEITLVAFRRLDEGRLEIDDIIETSNHHASSFARRFIRDPKVAVIATSRPGGPLHFREVRP